MTEQTDQRGRRSSPVEWVAAAVLLAALPVIVLGIYLAGREGSEAPDSAGEELDLISLLPMPAADSPFKITTAAKQWPAKRMHEKINGEDVVYLRHGCVGLAAMTLTNAAEQASIDVFLYHMATPAAAGKVFAEQAPAEDAPDPADRPEYVNLGDKAYLSYGCCYLRAGPYYLKLVAGSAGPVTTDEVLKLARRFVQALGTKDS